MMDPKPYTVLVLRPDSDWDGAQANWVLREHIMADKPSEAGDAAIYQCIAAYYTNVGGEVLAEPDDFAILAVYHGHLIDLYDPNQ